MPPFVVVPARPDDIEVIARLQFEACADDPGFQTIFPKGGTPRSVQHAVLQLEEQMNEDTTAHFMIVKDGMTGEVASFAIWHFCPARGQEEIEAEMLKDDFGPWPLEANIQAANKLVHNASRKRYEVVEKWFGAGAGHAYLSAVGTASKYRKQGAASLLLKWGTERADDLRLPSYLEATKSGYNVYRSYGFEEVDNLNIEIEQWGRENFLNFCMIRPAKSAA